MGSRVVTDGSQPSPLTVEEMVHALSLRDIRFYGLSAQLDEVAEPDADGAEAEGDSSEELDLKLNWNVRVRHDGAEFGVRFLVNVQAPFGSIQVDVAAEYEAPEPVTLSRDNVTEYLNNVSLMQLFPFIREAVNELSNKVAREPLLLPVFERGQMTLDLNPGPEISGEPA